MRHALDDESVVAGRTLPMSINDFARNCEALILAEQQKPLPDNDVIECLSNAVRFAREHTDRVFGRTKP